MTFAVFTALALGLAAPYLLLSWQPAWVRVLPRPGAWMELLKQFTALPLFATAIWLAWVYGQLYARGRGVNQIALLLGCFLLLAVAGWALGRWPAQWAQPSRRGRADRAGLWQFRWRKRAARPQPGAVCRSTGIDQPATGNCTVVWQPYSEPALDAAHAAGHPVFIDFTAAWCLSCQFNEQAVLDSADVESALLKGTRCA